MTVASHRADFIQYDALANLNISNPQDVHTHPELKRKLYSALAEDDEGELSIAIPKEVSVKSSGGGAGSSFSNEGVFIPLVTLSTTVPISMYISIPYSFDS